MANLLTCYQYYDRTKRLARIAFTSDVMRLGADVLIYEAGHLRSQTRLQRVDSLLAGDIPLLQNQVVHIILFDKPLALPNQMQVGQVRLGVTGAGKLMVLEASGAAAGIPFQEVTPGVSPFTFPTLS
jgi:hypothetical protein